MTTNSINNTGSDLTISNVNITGSTISTVSTNSNLTLSGNGTGKVSIGGNYTLPNADGTNAQVLATNGSGVLSFITNSASAGFSSIVTQVFTSSGTYTPTTGMSYCIVEIVGGGGGGGGAPATGVSQCSAGSGGGSGAYARKTFSAATIGASQTITIGTGGAGGLGTASSGAPGNASSFGSFITCNGGQEGFTRGPASGEADAGGNGGTATGGDLNITGNCGGCFSIYGVSGNSVCGGVGAASYFGGAATASANVGGNPGLAFGAGGSGASRSQNLASPATGGNGADGVCIITEFIA